MNITKDVSDLTLGEIFDRINYNVGSGQTGAESLVEKSHGDGGLNVRKGGMLLNTPGVQRKLFGLIGLHDNRSVFDLLQMFLELRNRGKRIVFDRQYLNNGVLCAYEEVKGGLTLGESKQYAQAALAVLNRENGAPCFPRPLVYGQRERKAFRRNVIKARGPDFTQ